MTFQWLAFLDAHRIEYATRGPNVSHGNVAIHCPFCGELDESQHLSVSINGRGWSCWRNVTHRGRSPVRLIAALLGCSYERARQLAGVTHLPEDFLGRVSALMQPVTPSEPPPLQLLAAFKPLSDRPTCRPFVRYLHRRGFPVRHPENLTDRYGIRYCLRDAFTGRLVFPVHCEGRLVTWTARSIHSGVIPRYKTLGVDAEQMRKADLPQAIGPISDYLLWFDDLLVSPNRRTLYLCEGPMDALKVRVLGRNHGIEATCLFTSAISSRQVEWMHHLAPRFGQVRVLLDREALPNAMRVADALASLRATVQQLPAKVKDPGELVDIEPLLR